MRNRENVARYTSEFQKQELGFPRRRVARRGQEMHGEGVREDHRKAMWKKSTAREKEERESEKERTRNPITTEPS